MIMENVCTGRALRIAVGIIIILFSLAGGAGATLISGCGPITSPGTYELSGDIIDSFASYCIVILSSNVTLDGKGRRIDSISNSFGMVGVSVNPFDPNDPWGPYLTNVTIMNLTVTDWNMGIHYRDTINGNIHGIHASNNNYVGIYLQYSYNTTLSRNYASISEWGISMEFSGDNMLNDNIVTRNTYGINLDYTSDNNTLSGNSAWDNYYGINLDYSSNNNTLSGNSASSNEYGIYLRMSFYNTLSGNYASRNYKNGITLFKWSDDNMLSGNNASNNWNHGIYLNDSSRNNTLSGNIAKSNKFTGIYLEHYSNNNTLSSNNASNNMDEHGIYLNLSSYNKLSGNIASKNWHNGIYLRSSSYNTLSGNNVSNNSDGIYLADASNNNLTGNNASNNYDGIHLADASNNNLTGNNASNNYVGIHLANASNNNLTGNTVNSNKLYGMELSFSSNNKIYNNIFNNTDYNLLYGVANNIWNTTKAASTNIIGGPNLGGNFWANPAGTGFSQTCSGDINGICDSPYTLDSNNIDYLPLKYNPGKSVQSSTGKGIVYFDSSAGTIENLIALNVNEIPEAPPGGVTLEYGLFRFNIMGLTSGGSVTLALTFPNNLPTGTTYWKYGATPANPTPHWYNITPAINGNNLTITITDGGVGDDDLTVNGIIRDDGGPSIPVSNIINSCTTISAPGAYVLTGDIIDSPATSCINITSSNVVLDGNGFRIDGVGRGGIHGVYVYNLTGLTNVIVKNVTVTDWTDGIYYGNVTNGNIENSNASNNHNGIYLQYYSNNNTLGGNNASNNYAGIYLLDSSNNTLSGNNASSNSYSNIGLYRSSNNTLSGNNASSNGIGIRLEYSSNNMLSGNIASSKSFTGISLSFSSSNTLSGNNASSNSYSGIGLSSSSNNTLSGNTANSNSWGISLYSFSNNNTLSGNNASSNDIGIYMYRSSNNTLSGNTANSNNNTGIFLASSSNNKIYNNHLNNTNNAFDNGVNYWNTTKKTGINIIGGHYLGGNYWASPDGTGFSQTCTGDEDGICDSPYAFDINKTDYLPLTYNSPGKSVQSSTGKGIVYFDSSAGTIEDLIALNVSDIPEAPPSGVTLEYGLFRFNITGLTSGGSVILTLNFPNNLPAGTTYWKYGKTPANPTPHWYNITPAINGKNLTITITDGGVGDDDLTTNGMIRDDGGPSIPVSNFINSCTTISTPGAYVLTGDIIDSPATSCINITSSDVVLDGNGFRIDGTDTIGTYGVYVHNSTILTNVTISNLNVTDWYNGIYYMNTRNGTIRSNNASSNIRGIYLYSSSNNTLNRNNASNNSIGIHLSSSINNTLPGNTANSNRNYGFYLSSSINNTLSGNNASSNPRGILLSYSSNNMLSSNNASNDYIGIDLSFSNNNTLSSNIANSNNVYGIDLSYSSSNTLSGNTANSNKVYGIYLTYSSNYNTMNGNNASNNNYGISMDSSSGNTLRGNIANSNNYYGIISGSSNNNNMLSGNTANFNNLYGIYLYSSSNNTLSGNNASNNFWDFYSSGNSLNNIVTNLTINPTISFTGKDIAIKSASPPAGDPGGYHNISKYINATNTGADSWLFLNITYSEGDVLGLDESTLRMWKYNGSWSQVAGTNGVETMQNYVYMNTTSFSIFAPMAESVTGGISECRTISTPGTYVLTKDIIDSTASSCINITSSDVVLDGNGFRIDGTDNISTYGVYVHNSTILTNVTISNLNVTDWFYGIYYENTRNGTIRSNNASSNLRGIYLSSSSNNTLNSNNASNNTLGIYLYYSGNNMLTSNTANSNRYYYGFFLVISNNNTLSGNNASNDHNGIYLSSSSNNMLNDNNVNSNNNFGIYLSSSSNNMLTRNTANSNKVNGISLSSSSINMLKDNNASSNGLGIYLDSSSNNNTLSGNNANLNNYYGISLFSSSSNTLTSNTANSNRYGIYLSSSSNNTLRGNNASNNPNGIYLYGSSNNKIYNNHLNNTNNAFDNGVNYWNTTKQSGINIIGGPYLGGNFWSNYAGMDINDDGLGDTLIPYNNSGNIVNGGDYLPLTQEQVVNAPSVNSSTGPVLFETNAGVIEELTALNVSDIPVPSPPSVNLSYGLFSFNITGLTPGGSANLTLTFPASLPPGTTYWKFGPNSSNVTPHWYDITASINGNNLTIMLADCGPGDDDLAANGAIVDPGGPSLPIPRGNVTGGGWIMSPIIPAPKNNNKATFGFVAQFDNGMPTGNLEYTDHVSGMKVKGDVTVLSVDKTTMTAIFQGTATINGAGAYAYSATVGDNGEPGRMDTFNISIPAMPYIADGILGGGNIQIHDP